MSSTIGHRVGLMDIPALLTDAFDRVHHGVDELLHGLDQDTLHFRADGEANTICWLVWHLTRIQDDHVAAVPGTEQRWTADGWYERFALPFEPSATGYGHDPRDVAVVTATGELLSGYYDAVHRSTVRFVSNLTAADLDRVVDERSKSSQP